MQCQDGITAHSNQSFRIPFSLHNQSFQNSLFQFPDIITMSTYTTYISQQQIRWSTSWRAGKVEFIQVIEAVEGVLKITHLIILTNS